MSYILGALKKAEKERKQDKTPGFDNWDQQEWTKPSESGSGSNLILYATLSTLMLVLIIFAWLAYKILITPNSITSPVAEEVRKAEPVRMEVIDASTEEVIPVYVEPADTEIPVDSKPERSAQKNPVKKVSIKQPETTNKVSSSETKNTSANRTYALPTFSGHIYFPNNHRLSRVFSGSESFREGDKVNGYSIESIGETQVLLSRSGKNFWVKLNN